MEELLYLEPDEEITSVIDKLKSLPGSSVALVLPKNAALAASAVNLKLLKREAKKLKKSIALVTQDKVGIGLAAQVGIPVYKSVGDDQPISAPKQTPRPSDNDVIELGNTSNQQSKKSQDDPDDDADIPVHRYDASKAAEPTPDSQPAVQPAPEPQLAKHTPGLKIHIRRGPMLTLIALALVLGGAWLLFIYPKATITLAVASEPVHESVTVIVDNNINEGNDEEGRIVGQKVQVETSVKETFDASGEKEVGEKATGSVTLSNRLGEAVAVPAGTTLSRDELEFVVTEETTISAATVSLDASGNVLVKPGTKQVTVEAAEVGDAYNLEPGDFIVSSFSGTKRDRVTGENSSAFSGGESRTVRVVTQEDIDNAKNGIGDKVNDQLIEELNNKARDLTVLGSTIEVEVADSSTSKQVDDEADQFELEANIRARTIGFVASEYQAMVVALVTKRIPEGKELVVTNEDSVETQVKEAKYDEGILTLESTLRTEMVEQLDTESLKSLIAGQTALSAEASLQQQDGIQSATIELRPSFKSTVPKNQSQIQIELDRK